MPRISLVVRHDGFARIPARFVHGFEQDYAAGLLALRQRGHAVAFLVKMEKFTSFDMGDGRIFFVDLFEEQHLSAAADAGVEIRVLEGQAEASFSV